MEVDKPPPPLVLLEEGDKASGPRYDVTAASVARGAGAGAGGGDARGASRGRAAASARARESFLIAAVAENRAREIGKDVEAPDEHVRGG
jgi:hypothetical protein